MKKIVFNNPFFFNDFKKNLTSIFKSKIKETSGGKQYFKKCSYFLEKNLKAKKAVITNSCTSALEISAQLIDVKNGDEIIMPSYTFVSTANAFVLRGGVPVYVDIKRENLNIDEKLIEKAITKKTKAIVVVHYAGVPCEMDTIKKIAKKYNLYLIEDAAQAIFSKYKNQYCGTIGDIGCLSFHETKNFTSCEGGAILINNKKFEKKLSIITHKGTDREYFNKNLRKYYSWVGLGSSHIPSEITCAVLYSQFQNYKKIINSRKVIWLDYQKHLKNLRKDIVLDQIGKIDHKDQNYHIYYLILKNKKIRDTIIEKLGKIGILAPFHYIPLHTTTMGKKFRRKNKLNVSEEISERIIRLPIWIGVNQSYIIKSLKKIINKFD